MSLIKNIANDVKVGAHLLFDDGAIDMEVIEIDGPMLIAKVMNDGILGARKSVNVPRYPHRFTRFNRKRYCKHKISY